MKDFVLMEDVILALKASCQLAPHFNPRLPFFPALCPAVDYVISLIRPFSNASVSTSAPLPALPRSVFKAFEREGARAAAGPEDQRARPRQPRALCIAERVPSL